MAERCASVPPAGPSSTRLHARAAVFCYYIWTRYELPIDLTCDARLEVTQLQSNGVAPDDPALLESLSIVRGIVKTQSDFYSCVEDPTNIFILGLWPSLEAHREFLASSRAGEVLESQEGMLEFRWSLHIELDAVAALPLEAPVIASTRRIIHR
ncbi:hypothetical protein CC80DRAFT_505370 [Byssothecium circinans]|uniref:ABM domain-containing protein n=1 Tax=Byssothecium circinans TaxID=147558 RepID=A0A6A5TUP5_9PLEO|nr:hypothetical protein CC80DRAFT_505370 [Byssothecium circinans]